MSTQEYSKYTNIPKEKFEFANTNDYFHDSKLETKPIGYFRDAFNRFSKNKASLVAAIIICILVLYAFIAPLVCHQNYVDSYGTATYLKNFKYLRPKLDFMEGTGIWDGTTVEEISWAKLKIYEGIGIETGRPVVVDILDEIKNKDIFGNETVTYRVRIDSYTGMDVILRTMTAAEYEDLQKWQDENGIQVILPRSKAAAAQTNPNVWFKSNQGGKAILNAKGELEPDYYTSGADDYHSIRLANDPGTWKYAQRTGTDESGHNYVCRLDSYSFFIYKYGFEPSFIFGTDASGYDIFSRLGSGARFSILFAVCVSVINLTIGAFYGAIEGYYGGAVDMIMERISDILSGIPFTVVTVLFSLHLTKEIGIVPAILLAFIMTGWIGMASSVRMQFYRFKNSEYVLAARTLGASDFRIMFKHIFPNSLGTLITGSVLVIPGVIFSETSLSYLGIINLDSANMSSVGTMLSLGQSCLTTAPHVVLFPALFIALLEISFNLFGNGLRDAFNPSLRGAHE